MLSEAGFRKKISFTSFLAALSVVLIHDYWIHLFFGLSEVQLNSVVIKIQYLINWIGNTYAVQFFFVLSGFLMFRHMDYASSLKRKMFSRIKTLLIPYILWNLFYLTFYLIAAKFGFSDFNGDISLKDMAVGIIFYKYAGHLWYIAYLIIYVCISPILWLLGKHRVTVYLFDIVYVCVFILSTNSIISDLHIFGMWFFYYLVGYNIATLSENLLKKKTLYGLKFAIIPILVFFVVITYYLSANGLVLNLLTLLTLYLFWQMLNIIDWDNFSLKPYMSKSFVIYAWHGMICSTIAKVLALKVLPPQSLVSEMIAYFAYFFVGVGVILMFDKIIGNACPKLQKLFSGNR